MIKWRGGGGVMRNVWETNQLSFLFHANRITNQPTNQMSFLFEPFPTNQPTNQPTVFPFVALFHADRSIIILAPLT